MYVEINKELYSVIFIKKKVKRTFLKLNRNKEIIITSPLKLSNSEIDRIIEVNKDWIIKQLSKVNNIKLEDNQFMLFGKVYNLINSIDFINNYKIIEDNIYINGNGLNKLINEANKVLIDTFYDLVKMYNLNFVPDLKLRSMKSKWGVCHYTKSKVVLNRILIHLPIDFVNYIIHHELTHFFVPNHSKVFYLELTKKFPDHRYYQKEIKKYAFLLDK